EGWSRDDVRCTVNDRPRAVTVHGDAVVITGITAGDDVACTFTNVQTLEPGISVVKRAWDVASWPHFGLPHGHPELPAGTGVLDDRKSAVSGNGVLRGA